MNPRSARRPFLAASLALAGSALFLFLRGRPTPMLRAYFGFAMCWALVVPFHSTGREFYVFLVLLVSGNLVIIPLIFRFLYLFPDGREPEGRWHRIWPWIFSVQGLFIALAFSEWMTFGTYAYFTGIVLAIAMVLVAATRRWLPLGSTGASTRSRAGR